MLNIETFNEILFKGLKPEAKKSELLEKECCMAYQVKIQAMEKLVKKLNNGKPYREVLQEVNNIDNSLYKLAEMLKEARKEEQGEI